MYETSITEGPSDDLAQYGRLKARRAGRGDGLRRDQHPGRAARGHALVEGRISESCHYYLRRAAGRPLRDGWEPGRSWFQYVDVRDLAEFVLTCAETGRFGRYDVVTPSGEHA